MAYCQDSDLLIKDVLTVTGELEGWVDRAASEMDSKLGFRYIVPIVPIPPATALATHEEELLKQINAKLASGRYLLASNQSNEKERVHAYGQSLLTEALNDLYCITEGRVDLTSALEASPLGGNESRRVPEALVADNESLLNGFENTVMRSEPWYVYPGAEMPRRGF